MLPAVVEVGGSFGVVESAVVISAAICRASLSTLLTGMIPIKHNMLIIFCLAERYD